MKKILFLVAVGAIGYAAYRQWSASQQDDDLWAAATDPVAPAESEEGADLR